MKALIEEPEEREAEQIIIRCRAMTKALFALINGFKRGVAWCDEWRSRLQPVAAFYTLHRRMGIILVSGSDSLVVCAKVSAKGAFEWKRSLR